MNILSCELLPLIFISCNWEPGHPSTAYNREVVEIVIWILIAYFLSLTSGFYLFYRNQIFNSQQTMSLCLCTNPAILISLIWIEETSYEFRSSQNRSKWWGEHMPNSQTELELSTEQIISPLPLSVLHVKGYIIRWLISQNKVIIKCCFLQECLPVLPRSFLSILTVTFILRTKKSIQSSVKM